MPRKYELKRRAERQAATRRRIVLTELYAYYRETEQMQAHIARDAPELPALEMLDAIATYWEQVSHILLDGWNLNETNRPALVAALNLARDFGTWQVLIRRSGLDDEQAVDLMVDLVACAAARRVL